MLSLEWLVVTGGNPQIDTTLIMSIITSIISVTGLCLTHLYIRTQLHKQYHSDILDNFKNMEHDLAQIMQKCSEELAPCTPEERAEGTKGFPYLLPCPKDSSGNPQVFTSQELIYKFSGYMASRSFQKSRLVFSVF